MNEDHRITLKRKGFVLQPDGSYSKVPPVVTRTQGTVVEFPQWHDAVGSSRSAKKSSARFRVRLIGYYVHPLDDCNFCTKYLVDCIRYAGIVADDNWGNLCVTHEQFQVQTQEEEATEIIVEEIL